MKLLSICLIIALSVIVINLAIVVLNYTALKNLMKLYSYTGKIIASQAKIIDTKYSPEQYEIDKKNREVFKSHLIKHNEYISARREPTQTNR